MHFAVNRNWYCSLLRGAGAGRDFAAGKVSRQAAAAVHTKNIVNPYIAAAEVRSMYAQNHLREHPRLLDASRDGQEAERPDHTCAIADPTVASHQR
jgi:hypothetical protein